MYETEKQKSLKTPLGIAFVTFKTLAMANDVLQAHKDSFFHTKDVPKSSLSDIIHPGNWKWVVPLFTPQCCSQGGSRCRGRGGSCPRNFLGFAPIQYLLNIYIPIYCLSPQCQFSGYPLGCSAAIMFGGRPMYCCWRLMISLKFQVSICKGTWRPLLGKYEERGNLGPMGQVSCSQLNHSSHSNFCHNPRSPSIKFHHRATRSEKVHPQRSRLPNC